MSSFNYEDFCGKFSYAKRMTLKDRIAKARTDGNLTQKQLAKAVGKSRAAVTQWESGKNRPKHSTIVDIANATGTTVMWLENGISATPVSAPDEAIEDFDIDLFNKVADTVDAFIKMQTKHISLEVRNNMISSEMVRLSEAGNDEIFGNKK